MNGSNWDQHTQDQAEGELIPNMKIVSKGKSSDGAPALSLECPECGTRFNSVISGDTGKSINCVSVSDADTGEFSLVAKCPACGCMWDGEPRRYFSICVLSDDIRFTDGGPIAQSSGSANIINAVEACDAKLAITLAQESLTSEVLKDSGGCLIAEIGRYDARAIWRKNRWVEAHKDQSTTASDLLQLQFDLEKEEKVDNDTRRERMQLGHGYAERNGTPYKGPQTKPILDIFRMMSGLMTANRENDQNNVGNDREIQFGDRSMMN